MTMSVGRSLAVILALGIAQTLFADDGHPFQRSPPPPPQIRRPMTQPPPRSRPPVLTMPTPPQRASPSCQTALNQSYNRTSSCLSQVMSSPNQTFRAQWCSNAGCRGQIRSSLTPMLDQCGRSDAVNDMIGDMAQRFSNMVQFMCQAPDTCSDDAETLASATRQGPAPRSLLDSLCQPCALKSLGQQSREKMSDRSAVPGNQIADLNRIAKSKAVCDSVDGEYCQPQIVGYNGSQPAQLCSPCFRRYFARMAFTGNTSTEAINPFKRLGAILDGGCIHDGNNRPCIKKLADLFNLTAPVLANLSATAPTHIPTPCSSACDPDCRQYLTTIATKAGTCSSAVKPFIRFLGVNVTDSCFGSVNITMPAYGKTTSRLTWVIATNDTAINICRQLTLDLATSLGVDRSTIQCTPKQTMIARRLLSNTQTVTTTSSDFSSDGSSTETTFTPDTVNGEVMSVSTESTITTMMTSRRATASPQDAAPSPSTSSGSSPATNPPITTPAPTSSASTLAIVQAMLVMVAMFAL